MAMKLFSFNIPKDLKEWSLEYVARKQIRGRNNLPSIGQLIRNLLRKEMDKDKEK